MIFFLNFWEILKTDFMNTVRQFHERHEIEKSLNATYVAVIPKKTGAMELRDFKPIIVISVLTRSLVSYWPRN